MTIKKWALGAMLLMLVSSVCLASSNDREDDDFRDHSADNSANSGLGFIVAGGGEFGGDALAKIRYTDGSKQNVYGGQGLTLSVGAHYRFASQPIDIMATIGYKYVTTKASNANIYIGRVVSALQVSYWFTDSWWVGAGPVWHSNNEFHGAQYSDPGDVPCAASGQNSCKFDTSMGVNLQAGWRFVALSYTNINYTDQFKNKYNASNFGVMLIGRF